MRILIPMPSSKIKRGHVAQSVARLSQRCRVRYLVGTHTFVSLSDDIRRAVFSYWSKYVRLVPVNRLGGLSLSRNSVVRLTDRPDMTIYSCLPWT